MEQILFRIIDTDKIDGGFMFDEDLLLSNHVLTQKRNHETRQIMNAYNLGLIILRFEWIRDIVDGGERLVVYRGKVKSMMI